MKKQMTDTENKKEEPGYIGHRQRLKARFLADGGKSMPEYELLELLLMYAIPRQDVKPLAKKILQEYYNLANVLVAPSTELVKSKGIGVNVAVLCGLIHICAKKICWENLFNRDVPVLSDKKRLAEYCRASIGYAQEEQLQVIYLDIHGQYIQDNVEQVGTIGAVMISPRDIVSKALDYKASRVIIAHNHPSGSCTPSKADIDMTKQVKEALKTVQIVLEDHIIISPREYYSMKEHLPFMNIN